MRRVATLALLAFFPSIRPVQSADEGKKADDSKIDFTRDIRPILANNCLLCHGPDPKNRKAKLRLDTREGILADLGGYAAVVPGKPDRSELYRRISASDPDEVMPPAKTGKTLTKAQIDLLRRWIEEGAPYPRHWAFVKPERPAPPEVRDAPWPRNEIDRFILARLEKEGLRPSPEADPTALIRRVSLDLTGLPPTLEETERFANDREPAAYEKLVDRLLESSAFGERWARVWLDLARYADSQGYAEDLPRTIWAFRDWVIRALNENMPFDQFTVEQIAGDLLPDPSDAQLQATAFHRNTLTNTEGGTDDEEFRNVAVVDRVNTTLQAWMGLAFNCAQCHDHKYDPFSQEEYFRLFAFFNNTEDGDQPDERPFLPLYTDAQKQQRKEVQEKIRRLEKELEQAAREREPRRPEWEAWLTKPFVWKTLSPTELRSTAGSTLTLKDDASVLAAGEPTPSETYAVRAATDLKEITALRLEALPDPSLPWSGPGRAENADFFLSRLTLSAVPPDARPVSGRFVRIELPGRQKILSLAEVQIFSDGKNAAPGGKAGQSSTDNDGAARLAVDDKTSGDFFTAQSTTLTTAEPDPWWEIDLGKTLPIERILVWGRTDGGREVAERIAGFRLRLLDEERRPVQEWAPDEIPNPLLEWAPDGNRGVSFRGASDSTLSKELPARPPIKISDLYKHGWSVGPKTGTSHEMALALDPPLPVPAGTTLQFRLEHLSTRAGASLGRFRLSVTDAPQAPAHVELPAEIRKILQRPEEKRSREEADEARAHYRRVALELAPFRDRLDATRKQLDAVKPRTTVPVMKELAGDKRRKTHVHVRGNFLVKGKEVAEGVPAVFHPFPEGEPLNRLGLARWLVHPDNPLTARVAVNRHWEQLFGQGLVSTSEDFGVRGELPSHPALLDWLATELVRLKWDVKKLLRLMVTSAAYRQSSPCAPEILARDPWNRLLARGPRIRLSAEAVRDQALFAAGLLSRKGFGPSVQPPRPKLGLKAAFSISTDWETSAGEDKYRRGIYTFWRRTIPYPSMATFDAPDRNVCTIRRISTNTPLQALVTMNDPVYVEAAQALARRMAAEGGTTARERAAHGFRRCLARPPREAELDRLVALYEEARTRFGADREKAVAMATDPLGPAPEGMDVVDLAAWTVVGNVLLNLDEMFLKR